MSYCKSMEDGSEKRFSIDSSWCSLHHSRLFTGIANSKNYNKNLKSLLRESLQLGSGVLTQKAIKAPDTKLVSAELCLLLEVRLVMTQSLSQFCPICYKYTVPCEVSGVIDTL